MNAKRHTIIYWTGFCVIMALLIVAPLVLPEYWRRFLTEILIWGLLAMSSDLLIGYTGIATRRLRANPRLSSASYALFSADM